MKTHCIRNAIDDKSLIVSVAVLLLSAYHDKIIDFIIQSDHGRVQRVYDGAKE